MLRKRYFLAFLTIIGWGLGVPENGTVPGRQTGEFLKVLRHQHIDM